MKNFPLLLARHSETLSWYALADLGDSVFDIVALNGDQSDKITKPRHFKATHRHYKGGLYQKLGITLMPKGDIFEVYVVYGDEIGNYWIRPITMFKDDVSPNVARFAAL